MQSWGIQVWLYSFFNLGSRLGWVVNATPRPLYLRERDPARIVQEAGWAVLSVWTGAENVPCRKQHTVSPLRRLIGYWCLLNNRCYSDTHVKQNALSLIKKALRTCSSLGVYKFPRIWAPPVSSRRGKGDAKEASF